MSIIRLQIIWLVVLVLSTGLAAGAETLVVKDELGQRVEVSASPQRIVPLAPSVAEILFALGLDERIVGVTEFTTYPREAAKKPLIGSFKSPSLEKIVALRPDLVIAGSEDRLEQINAALVGLGIPFYQIKPTNLEDIYRSIANLGKVTGTQEAAAEVIARMRKRVAEVAARIAGLPPKKVFYQVHLQPIVSVGRQSFAADLIKRAGGVLITDDIPIRYPRYSIEKVIAEAPDIIIISSMEQAVNYSRFKEIWKRYVSIPAVRDDRIYVVKSELVDRASPRIVEGFAKLAEFIHPDCRRD